MRNPKEFVSMRERLECVRMTLVGSTLLGLLLLAAFEFTSSPKYVERLWTQYSALWFIGWWAFCHFASSIKIRMVQGDRG